MLRYENRHLWAPLKSGDPVLFPSDEATKVVVRFNATVDFVVRASTLSADGEPGEPFLIGLLEAGQRAVTISHGKGLAVWAEYGKGELWVYDDREQHQQIAPVGVSFTKFEKPGHLMNDPMQVIIHRDNVRKALERMAVRDVPAAPDKVAELEALLERTTKRLEALEKPKNEAPDDKSEAGAQQAAS